MSALSEAVAKLEAVRDVRPDIAPVVDAALAVVKVAQHEVSRATERAAAAEALVTGVRPHLEVIERRAQTAENRLRVRETLEKAAEERELDEQRHREAARSDKLAIREALDALAKSTETLVPLIEVFCAVGMRTRDAHGKSAVENRDHSATFDVSDGSGRFVTQATRKDAISIVRKMLAIERSVVVVPHEDDDDPDTNEPKAGRLDGARLKKRVAKRGPRIL